ncbi:hypothetical protein COV93_08450 [Candidatus Woesearchaeota archaeon CG11_big_fil_rev_8_21_14_0_20_43_8]|nr:MAG: hypothetical protein COV93_08450 [Candidatus Woesearchaeota archaeon CG11_big_fil_rev_8_21_14_0_20_43_8]PIO05174.1 MAG: hypothetical protein COT47_05890 [Candidatus Woesearchaeota archaeon CG08_land_8_20_14_0_20_43_7]
MTILDTTPPKPTCPEVVEAPDSLKVSVSDAVDDRPIITSDALSTFPIGKTLVTVTATDASGNKATCHTYVVNKTYDSPVVVVQSVVPATHRSLVSRLKDWFMGFFR